MIKVNQLYRYNYIYITIHYYLIVTGIINLSASGLLALSIIGLGLGLIRPSMEYGSEVWEGI